MIEHYTRTRRLRPCLLPFNIILTLCRVVLERGLTSFWEEARHVIMLEPDHSSMILSTAQGT